MKFNRTTTQPGGFVIVVVLCTIIMLAVLLFGFNHKSRAELFAADGLRKSVQALNCAGAGLNVAIAVLKGPSDIRTNGKLMNLLSGQQAITLGEGTCSITVTEENGKLNVNLLRTKTGKLDRTRIDQLLRLIDLLNRRDFGDSRIGYGLVPSIIDWTDTDEETTCLPFVKHQNLGAESDYYSDLVPPYRSRNGPLDTTEELLLIKGITPQILDRIRDYLTVKGDGKININCASKLVIESLSEKMGPALAQMIIDRREIRPFAAITELRDVPGMTDGIYQAIRKTATVRPTDQYYQVTARGNADSRSCTIVALIRRNTATKNVDVILYKEFEGDSFGTLRSLYDADSERR